MLRRVTCQLRSYRASCCALQHSQPRSSSKPQSTDPLQLRIGLMSGLVCVFVSANLHGGISLEEFRRTYAKKPDLVPWLQVLDVLLAEPSSKTKTSGASSSGAGSADVTESKRKTNINQ